AVAALTGRPVRATVAGSVADHLVRVEEYESETGEFSFVGRAEGSEEFGGGEVLVEEGAEFSDDASEQVFEGEKESEEQPVSPEQPEEDVVEGFSNVPDWFKKAQKKARKPVEAAPSAYRSRYADALDAAMSESSVHFENANRATELTVEQRLQQVRESIMEPRVFEANRDVLAEQAPLSDDQQPAPASAPAAIADAPAHRELFIPSLVLNQRNDDLGATQGMDPLDAVALRSELSKQSPVPSPERPSITSLPSFMEEASAEKTAEKPIEQPAVSSPRAANSLLSSLPSIGAQPSGAAEGGKNAALLTLPTFGSSSLRPVSQAAPSEDDLLASGMPKSASASAGSTIAFAPVADNLMENGNPDDLYVEDADDSGYEAGYSDAGSFSSPDYVDMPKSRLQRFFGKFGRRKKEPEVTTQEWLDVDEDFDARSVGAARGGWESFLEDSDGDEGLDFIQDEPSRRRGWNGGMYVSEGFEPSEEAYDQIDRFYRSGINTEVWFVALGAELTGNNGMRAFLQEHAQELRGAVIVELDAMGAGEMCLAEKEGAYLPAQTSSRMKRYAKKAASSAGLSLGSVSIPWNESAASCAIKQGAQAMHLVGIERGKPALYAQKDDVLENVDEDTLLRNADFVMELLRSI
ncbi:MAG: M28 family peptidase, partial [Eggerthellaceae bacterium]|nr:M28 family peptidase [Eggerthellaceae bacterium]